MIPLKTGPSKAAAARRCGKELEGALRTLGIGARRIQDVTGVSRSTMRQYIAGYNLPGLQTARTNSATAASLVLAGTLTKGEGARRLRVR